MKNLMKSTLLTVIMLCFVGLQANSLSAYEILFNGGGVVTEGDFLISTCDNPDDTIVAIYMEDESGRVYEFNGCGESECSDFVGNLPTGLYTVEVITTLGGFEDEVYLK